VRRIIEHLLKLECSPSSAPRADGRYSVPRARDEVEHHITASMHPDVAAEPRPAVRPRAARCCAGASRHGAHDAAQDLPTVCPYDA
jgi:hypothetical protein